MAVSEYKIDCRYRMGDLKPHIYLLDKTGATINVQVDNENINVSGLTGRAMYKLNGLKVRMTSEQHYEGRFRFNNKVEIEIYENTLSAHTEVINFLRHDTEFYVVVEDKMGNFYLMNPEFPAYFTYDYVFTDNPVSANTCTMTFESDSNFPSQLIQRFTPSFLTTLVQIPCAYIKGEVVSFQLTELGRAYIEETQDGQFSNIQYTAGLNPFVYINFIKNSFQFRERYDGKQFIHTVQFSIPLDDYKSYWEYALTEFTKNRYITLFQTASGNTIASGFETGYFPTYSIETSEESSILNLINITLTDISTTPMSYKHTGIRDAVKNDGGSMGTPDNIITGVDGSTYITSICIDEQTKIYTLLQVVTRTGQKLDEYWVLQGWEEYYENLHLNIVGTYTPESDFGFPLTFRDTTCKYEIPGGGGEDECGFMELPVKSYTFNLDNLTADFFMKASCDWVFEYVPSWIRIGAYGNVIPPSNIIGGKGKTEYHFTIYYIGEATKNQDDIITIRMEDKTYDFDVHFFIGYGDIVTWVELVDLYICEGDEDTGIYKRYKKLQKYINNQPAKPTEYKKGELLSESWFSSKAQCEDPNGKYTEEEKWVLVDGYICEYNSAKGWYERYEKLQKFINGIPVRPYEYKKGELVMMYTADSSYRCEDADYTPDNFWKLVGRICEKV